MTTHLSKAEREIIAVVADLLDAVAEQDELSVLRSTDPGPEQEDNT